MNRVDIRLKCSVFVQYSVNPKCQQHWLVLIVNKCVL